MSANPRTAELGYSHGAFRRGILQMAGDLVVAISVAMFLFHGSRSEAKDLRVERVKLPPLKVNGEAARAHTQGFEVAGGRYYVTARRDDVKPRRALLLRTVPEGTTWDVWDITPSDPTGATTALDHPG